jgi:molybdopterin synthase catalytic subunit
MAESELASIIAEAEDRFSVSAIIVEHRVGTLAIGDVSVAIVAAHTHRAPALDCTRYVIEEIKKRVPIWKREHYANGTREWIDPTASRGIATA